jgi:sugar/nucleoside kinase (ribokinase family)
MTVKENDIQYLCIGHSCHDMLNDKNILGGTTSYSSIVVKQLGLKVGVLTSVGNDFEFFDVFEKQNILFHNKRADKTTVFENIYEGTKRIQFIHARGETLYPKDVPAEWLNVPVVQFSLIADEADFSLLKTFPNALVGVTIQGWLRKWDEKGRVSAKAMDWVQLKAANLVIMSDADIQGFEYAIPEIASYVDVLVMTQGANGAMVFKDGKEFHFPAYPIVEVDSTGAGDVFTAAFMVKYAETKDIALASGFAHSAASFVVEGIGINNLTEIERINDRFEDYKKRFLLV